jgi:chaperonin GroES
MTAAIKPLYDRVLVQRVENEQMSAGGIIIPDTAQEKTQIGVIAAVGEGKLMSDSSIRPLKVKKGDKVIFGKYAGTEISLGSVDYLILREEELLGIVEK